MRMGALCLMTIWKPSWGLRAKDIVVGCTKHAKDWSHHAIPLHDYKYIVMSTRLDAAESTCAQAIATVIFFIFCLLISLFYSLLLFTKCIPFHCLSF